MLEHKLTSDPGYDLLDERVGMGWSCPAVGIAKKIKIKNPASLKCIQKRRVILTLGDGRILVLDDS